MTFADRIGFLLPDRGLRYFGYDSNHLPADDLQNFLAKSSHRCLYLVGSSFRIDMADGRPIVTHANLEERFSRC